MFLPRRIYPAIKSHLQDRQITVITGIRRSGKTTILKQLLSEIDSKNRIYLDLQRLDYRNIFNEKNFDNILLKFGQLGLDVKQKMFVFLDEIQFVHELPGIIKYLYDHNDIKFIVSGSSSYYLKNLFTESLAGRKRIFELYPLDFDEFLDFKTVRRGKANFPSETFSDLLYDTLGAHYDEYVRFGGFPEVVLAPDLDKKRALLDDIISSYINIDVRSLTDFRKKDDFYKIVKMLASRIGARIDYAKLSRLTGINAVTLKNYLDFFEDTYLIKRVPVFTKNADREIVKAKKLYFVDSGLAGILADLNSGAKFENAVYCQLRHKGEVKYFSMKDGREIDFILNEKVALEVKETPTESDLNDLKRMAERLSLAHFSLVGKNKSPNFEAYIWGGSIR